MPRSVVASLFLLVGLPAAGKTTTARRLAQEHGALRLTPDEWMLPLFGDADAAGTRDVLEGRLITVALQVLRLGTDVVLDLGCWARDERSALRRLAERAGASFVLVHLPVDRATQLERIASRWEQAPAETFRVSTAELDQWREQFEAPDADEVAGVHEALPPAGWDDWTGWARHRWPSLDVG